VLDSIVITVTIRAERSVARTTMNDVDARTDHVAPPTQFEMASVCVRPELATFVYCAILFASLLGPSCSFTAGAVRRLQGHAPDGHGRCPSVVPPIVDTAAAAAGFWLGGDATAASFTTDGKPGLVVALPILAVGATFLASAIYGYWAWADCSAPSTLPAATGSRAWLERRSNTFGRFAQRRTFSRYQGLVAAGASIKELDGHTVSPSGREYGHDVLTQIRDETRSRPRLP